MYGISEIYRLHNYIIWCAFTCGMQWSVWKILLAGCESSYTTPHS